MTMEFFRLYFNGKLRRRILYPYTLRDVSQALLLAQTANTKDPIPGGAMCRC